MQSRFMYQLVLSGLAAMALLLLAALACGKDATPAMTEGQSNPNARPESRREQVLTPQTEYLEYIEPAEQVQASSTKNVHIAPEIAPKTNPATKEETISLDTRTEARSEPLFTPQPEYLKFIEPTEQVQATSTKNVHRAPEIVPTASPATKEKPMNTSQASYMTPSEAVAKARAIRHKYDALFWRQPNVHGVGIGNTKDENGQWTGKWGFIISVTEKVDQNTLLPEDRIPDILEGVIVQIREEEEGELIPTTMEESNGSD